MSCLPQLGAWLLISASFLLLYPGLEESAGRLLERVADAFQQRERRIVSIKPHERWGRWDGWGVSLSWWANVLGDRDDLAQAVFTMNASVQLDVGVVPGLGLNLARYNAGASSWRKVKGQSMVESANIPRFKQIEGFWQDSSSDNPTSSSWNWAVDAKQVAMLQKANDLGANLFELFSNSPMWWMLCNHNPSGAENGTDDNLKMRSHHQHARYLASVAAHAERFWGVTFHSVEPFNEPSLPCWTADNGQEGCHFKQATQAEVIPALKAELESQGLSAVVAASDENKYQEGLDTWRSFNPDVRNAVGRVNVHGYQGIHGPRHELFKAVSPKPLWNTEYGDEDGTGLTMALVISLDFYHLHNTAWCYWQIADESGGWGLLRFNAEEKKLLEVNTKYFVFAHYTRHIRPGMEILGSGHQHTVAAYDEVEKRLVLVTANPGQKQEVRYDLSGFTHVGGPIVRWETSAKSKKTLYAEHQDLELSDKGFVARFRADSLQTFEIHNVTLDNNIFL